MNTLVFMRLNNIWQNVFVINLRAFIHTHTHMHIQTVFVMTMDMDVVVVGQVVEFVKIGFGPGPSSRLRSMLISRVDEKTRHLSRVKPSTKTYPYTHTTPLPPLHPLKSSSCRYKLSTISQPETVAILNILNLVDVRTTRILHNLPKGGARLQFLHIVKSIEQTDFW